jgi:hypothetical protein
VSDIYKAANPAPELTTKIRASSVSGNIGESVLALVVRRLLGATQALDVLPINVTPEAKCPDFRIQIRPGFPAAFQAVTGLTPRIEFDYWPAESKAVQSQGRARTVVKNALTVPPVFFRRGQAGSPSRRVSQCRSPLALLEKAVVPNVRPLATSFPVPFPSGVAGNVLFRAQRETEAEAVAYVVFTACGMELATAASDYIQLYQGTPELLMDSLGRIQWAASQILPALVADVHLEAA